MRRTDVARAIALLAVAVSAPACDLLTGKKDGSFTLTISDPSVSLGQGGKDTVLITITRSDYSKPIALTIVGVPTGTTALLSPSTVPAGAQSSQLFLTAAVTAAPGTATLTIRANGEGLAEQTATIALSVSVTGNFSLGSPDVTAVAAQGGGATATILVTRTGGHADNVSLTVSGAPSGVTALVSPSATVGGSAALTIAAAQNAVVGSYALQVSGTAPGLATQTTTISLNVIAPPSTAPFSMPFCANSIPSWFAYKNEGFPWQQLSPTSNTFSFSATAKVAVAYAFVISNASTNQTRLQVLYADRSELAAQSDRDCAGSKTLNGSIVGATTGQSVRVSMGAAVATPTAASPNYTLSGVADRALDLVATNGVITNQGNLVVTPDRMVIRRALNPTTGSSISALDFPGESFVPATSNLTIANTTAGDQFDLFNTLWTSTATYGLVHAVHLHAPSTTVYSVPASQMQPGDLHELLVEAYQSDLLGFTYGRINVAYVGAIADRTETLAAVLSTPTVTTLASSPYLRLRGLLPVQAEYTAASQFGFFQDGGASADRLVFVAVTSAFLGAVPNANWDVAIPDFGIIFGLNTNWMLAPGPVIYQVVAYSGRSPVLFGAVPVAGDVVRVAYRVLTTSALLTAGIRPFHERVQYLRR